MTDVITGERVVLRPLTDLDRPRMREILAQPSLAPRWLGTRGLDGITDDLFDTADHTPFAILLGDEVIGHIQFSEETDSDYRHAGIDVFPDSGWQGQGLGTDAVRTLTHHLIRERGHHRVTIEPAADNEPAIRAYARAGFRPVGVMRSYERGADGTWHDGLLMDALAADLSPGD